MSFNKGSFGAGILDGFRGTLQYGNQNRNAALQRDRLKFDREKFDYSKTRDIRTDSNWDKEYKIAVDTYNLNSGKDTRDKTTWTRTEFEADEKQLYRDNDRIIAAGQDYGFISKTDPSKLDRENTIALIREGGRVNDSWVMDRANASKGTGIPEGFTITRLDRDPTTGEIAAYGTHANQKNPQHLTDKLNPGVITTDGSSEGDSPIAVFSPEKLAGLLDDEYRLTIPLNSGLGSTSALAQFGALTEMSDADAEVATMKENEARQAQAALNTLHVKVITANDKAAADPATGEGTNVEMMRDFRGMIASAESEEERLEILIEAAETYGVEVPDVLMGQGASNEPSASRRDGSKKSTQGWIGPMKNEVTGGTMTEFSTDLGDGSGREIPTMVEAQSEEALAYMRKMPEGKGFDLSIPMEKEIVEVARREANKRIDAGKSQWYQDTDSNPPNEPPISAERQLGTSPGRMGQEPIEGDDLLMTGDNPNRYQTLQHGLPTRYRPAVLEKKITEHKAVLEENGLDTEKGRAAQDKLDALMQQKYGEDSFVDNAVSPEAKAAAEKLHNGILAKFDQMTNEETAAAITTGEAVATEEDRANLATVLRDGGVATSDDIKNLPLKTQRHARALLAIIAPESAQRNQFAKELVSIGTGGTALSSPRELDAQRTAEDTLAVNQRNAKVNERSAAVAEARVPIDRQRAATAANTLELNRLERGDALLKYVDSQADKIGKEVTDQLNNVINSMYDLDDEDKPIPGQISDFNYARVSSALSESLSVISRKLGTTREDSAAEAQLENAQNAIFSMGIQALAESEDYGSFGEIFPDGEIDFFDQNDNALSRVDIFSRVESGKNKGQPLRWMIRSLGSKTQLEETIPSSVVKNMFGDEGYKAFVESFEKVELERRREKTRVNAKVKRDKNDAK